MTKTWQPGSKNLITDVCGLSVGHAACAELKSGVTVLSSDVPFLASVDVMGGAPGSRETELLGTDKLVEQVDALVLSGGSAFGLDAASGVVDALRRDNRGFAVGPVKVPIVPGAIIFDLINGGNHAWTVNPYPQLGREAYDALSTDFNLGSIGAGIGATTGNIKGGLGSASLSFDDGLTVGALVVANPHGQVTIQNTKHFWAAPFEFADEFGGCGVAQIYQPELITLNNKFAAYEQLYGAGSTGSSSAKGLASHSSEQSASVHSSTIQSSTKQSSSTQDSSLQGDSPNGSSSQEEPPQGMNTTIAIVATNASLTKAQLKRFAVAAQDGLSRAIVPAHTPLDGDLIFSVSTAAKPLGDEINGAMLLGHAASICLSRAIARGVFHASTAQGDTLPSWHSLYGELSAS